MENNEEKLAKALEFLHQAWVTVDFFNCRGTLSKEIREFLESCNPTGEENKKKKKKWPYPGVWNIYDRVLFGWTVIIAYRFLAYMWPC